MTKEELMAFGLIQIATLVLKAAAILLPLICVAVFVHAWKGRRSGRQRGWHSRFLTLAALTVLAVTLLRTSLSMQFTCVHANAVPWGATTLPLALANIGHACKLFSVGIVASGFCLALALLLPIGNSKGGTSTG